MPELSAYRLKALFGVQRCSEWPVWRPAAAKSRRAVNGRKGPIATGWIFYSCEMLRDGIW